MQIATLFPGSASNFRRQLIGSGKTVATCGAILAHTTQYLTNASEADEAPPLSLIATKNPKLIQKICSKEFHELLADCVKIIKKEFPQVPLSDLDALQLKPLHLAAVWIDGRGSTQLFWGLGRGPKLQEKWPFS